MLVIAFAALPANYGEDMCHVRDAESPSEVSVSVSASPTNARIAEWSSNTASAHTAVVDSTTTCLRNQWVQCGAVSNANVTTLSSIAASVSNPSILSRLISQWRILTSVRIARWKCGITSVGLAEASMNAMLLARIKPVQNH